MSPVSPFILPDTLHSRASGTLVIIGVGLIGGSFSLALKRAGWAGEVVGVGRAIPNLTLACELGVIDRYAPLSDAIRHASVILLATPVGQMPAVFEVLAAHAPADALITDAGSTKADVAALVPTLGHLAAQFVPGHPIAGAEHSGAGAARAELFHHRQVILTPLEAGLFPTDAGAVAEVAALWRACGAVVSTMTAEQHDRVFAAVSHLPHLLSFALVEMLADRPDADVFFRFAASGFRDFTRIASSHPEMWRDISLANRAALLDELAAYRGQLDKLTALLDAHDGPGLAALFSTAQQARNGWLAGHGKHLQLKK